MFFSYTLARSCYHTCHTNALSPSCYQIHYVKSFPCLLPRACVGKQSSTTTPPSQGGARVLHGWGKLAPCFGLSFLKARERRLWGGKHINGSGAPPFAVFNQGWLILAGAGVAPHAHGGMHANAQLPLGLLIVPIS